MSPGGISLARALTDQTPRALARSTVRNGEFYGRTARRWRLRQRNKGIGGRWDAPARAGLVWERAGRRRRPAAQRTQPSAQGLDWCEASIAEPAIRSASGWRARALGSGARLRRGFGPVRGRPLRGFDGLRRVVRPAIARTALDTARPWPLSPRRRARRSPEPRVHCIAQFLA